MARGVILDVFHLHCVRQVRVVAFVLNIRQQRLQRRTSIMSSGESGRNSAWQLKNFSDCMTDKLEVRAKK